MTKIAVISYNTLNSGDEIQSLATRRLIESLGKEIDLTIDREGLSDFKSNDKVKLVCNGWFMEKPDKWPPSNDITPLFISMHISHQFGSYEKMVDNNAKNYFKNQLPVGCRDYHTLRLLKENNIDSYFSGCMTLTLENKFKGERGNSIVLADPFYHIHPYAYEKNVSLKLVPKKYHKDIVWTTHRRKTRNISQEQRVKDAEKLIEIYSKAKIVITSRIHVALPCLALGTPVVFVDSGYESEKLKNRFEGLVDNMRTIGKDELPYSTNKIKDTIARIFGLHKLSKLPENIDIDWDNPPKNPTDISPIANGIKAKVKEFIS